MPSIVVTGRQASYYMTCPDCDQPMRFDHALEVLAEGLVRQRRALFAAGLRLHTRYGCPASPE